MTTGKRTAIGITLALLLALAIRVEVIHHDRNASAPAAPAATATVDPDEVVFLKQQRPSSLADVKQLIGATVWVSAGGQLDYYPCAGHRANYAHSAGTLLGADGGREIRTPYPDCVLIMPSRRLIPGQTAVRLGRYTG